MSWPPILLRKLTRLRFVLVFQRAVSHLLHPQQSAPFLAGCHVPRLRGHVSEDRLSMPTQAWSMAPGRSPKAKYVIMDPSSGYCRIVARPNAEHNPHIAAQHGRICRTSVRNGNAFCGKASVPPAKCLLWFRHPDGFCEQVTTIATPFPQNRPGYPLLALNERDNRSPILHPTAIPIVVGIIVSQGRPPRLISQRYCDSSRPPT